MTKADIVETLYEDVGFSKKDAADLVELVFDTLKSTLARGEKVKISGFGNFIVREKESRIMEEILRPARVLKLPHVVF